MDVIERAKAFWEDNQDQKAIDTLDTPEMATNPEALFILGDIYYQAHKSIGGVSRSAPKARKYWLKAVELGSAEAAFGLGKLYSRGDGVRQNDNKAEEFWLIASEGGHEEASYELAEHYRDSRPEKIEDAIRLYESLAANPEGFYAGLACCVLARTYDLGKSVDYDIHKVIFWYTAGMERNHAMCIFALALIHYSGDGVERDVDKAIALLEQVAEDENLGARVPAFVEAMRNGTLPTRQEVVERHRQASEAEKTLKEGGDGPEDEEDLDHDRPLQVRSVTELRARAIILYAMRRRADGVSPSEMVEWLKTHGLWEHVSPEESAYLCHESPPDRLHIQASWRVEALEAVLWSLGDIRSMVPATRTCDQKRIKRVMAFFLKDPSEFLNRGSKRSDRKIFDALDAIKSLHADIRSGEETDSITGVVIEKHQALEWVTDAQGEPWDEVSTDT